MIGRYVIEHGDVWLEPAPDRRSSMPLSSRRTHVCDGTGELAIAILDDAMIKSGSAAGVEAWLEKNGGSGFDITVVRFPVSAETVEELNACLANPNRGSILIERLMEIGVSDPTLAARPRYPR